MISAVYAVWAALAAYGTVAIATSEAPSIERIPATIGSLGTVALLAYAAYRF